MAKPHKFFWTGIDIETSADPEDIWATLADALTQTKGKFTRITNSGTQNSYEIKGSETLFATAPEMTFEVQISDDTAGRRVVRTRVITALLKDGGMFSGKKMLGQKAFMTVSQTFGRGVGSIDPTAVARLREGPMPDDFALTSLSGRVSPPLA